jgi:hypothetical protein
MRLWGPVVRALPTTFVIYVLQALVALVVGLPASLSLLEEAPTGSSALSHAQWLERFIAWGAPARLAGVTGLLVVALWLLLSPWLHMAWLSALAQPASLGTSLAHGAQRWWRACLVSVLVAVFVAVAAMPFALVVWLTLWMVDGVSNDRVHDLALMGSVAPALPLALAAHAWHDLARARALHEGAFRATLRSARDALRIRVGLSALIWLALGNVMALGAHGLCASLNRSAAWHVGILQAALLGRLIVRSRWLAHTLERTAPPPHA